MLVCSHCWKEFALVDWNDAAAVKRMMERLKDHWKNNKKSHPKGKWAAKAFKAAVEKLRAGDDVSAVEVGDAQARAAAAAVAEALPAPGQNGFSDAIMRLLTLVHPEVAKYVTKAQHVETERQRHISSRMKFQTATVKMLFAPPVGLPEEVQVVFDELVALIKKQKSGLSGRMMQILHFAFANVYLLLESAEQGSFDLAVLFEREHLQAFLAVLDNAKPYPLKPSAQLEYVRSWLSFHDVVRTYVNPRAAQHVAARLKSGHSAFRADCEAESKRLRVLNRRVLHVQNQIVSLDRKDWPLAVVNQNHLYVRAYQLVYTVYELMFLKSLPITRWHWRLVTGAVVVVGMLSGACSRPDFWVQLRWSDVEKAIVNEQDYISLTGISKNKNTHVSDTHQIVDLWWRMVRMWRALQHHFFPGEQRCCIDSRRAKKKYGPHITKVVKLFSTVATGIEFDPGAMRIAVTSGTTSRLANVTQQNLLQPLFSHSLDTAFKFYLFLTEEESASRLNEAHDLKVEATHSKVGGQLARIHSRYSAEKKMTTDELIAASPLFDSFNRKMPTFAAMAVDADQLFAANYYQRDNDVVGLERRGEYLFYLFRDQRGVEKNYLNYNGVWKSVAHLRHPMKRVPVGADMEPVTVQWDAKDAEVEAESRSSSSSSSGSSSGSSGSSGRELRSSGRRAVSSSEVEVEEEEKMVDASSEESDDYSSSDYDDDESSSSSSSDESGEWDY
jgi:hypothetical protein